ncbi:hypothetical protein EGW08_006873 [Elysia chlorotica]|uniref:Uncharacterized protein n=1 Tax=Elysia chlorotica TaxID=188477 RepID=A0A433TUS3_ELYCH|nr:hypothetical protein EGW08_006873 [Elysia chlorotica]
MYQLSCQLVCEWASQLLDKQFSDIKTLSEYLISIGLSCGKTASMFTMMSGNTSPPKLSTDKKNLSTRLVQRRLQHNEIIRKHKDKIKQQLKFQREQQALMAQQKRGHTLFYKDMSSQSTIFSSSSITILPRPLSVQPYMCNSTSSKDIHSSSIWCTSISKDVKPASGDQHQNIDAKPGTEHSSAQTKRCQSTSLVEKHLVSPYKLVGPLVDEQAIKSLTNKIAVNDDGRSHSEKQYHPYKQTFMFSTSEVTSRSPSISPITTTAVGGAARNISRLLESPAHSAMLVVHQNKRTGEEMSQEEAAFVKKRCTTSIGVLKQGSLDSTICRKENDFTVVRPYSCPISFHECNQSKKSKKKGMKSVKASAILKSIDWISTDKSDDKCATPEKVEIQKIYDVKDTKSFHFVQKPQVISRLEITSPSSLSNSKPTPQETTGRTRYNILNSLLSSDYDMMPAVNEPIAHSQIFTKGDQVPHLRRISCASHTNYTDGFRSAFVPVTSQKQHTNSTAPAESSLMKLELNETKETKDKGDDKMVGSEEKNRNCNNSSIKLNEKSFNSQYQCTTTTSSSSSSSSSTLCQSGDSVVSFATPTPTIGNQKLATASAPATLSKVSSSSFSPAWSVSTAQSWNNGPDCISVAAGSPSLVPKKTNKNRFTPIRPKLDGCLHISPQKLRASSTSTSPQKRDMRPVHTILQEHRVKNAQDLLANLAQNYQAELGLPAPCNVSSESVIVSFGPKSESFQKSVPPGAASLNVLSSLPVQNFPRKETPRPISVSNTCRKIFQSHIPKVVSVSSSLSESQVILLPSSTHNEAVSEAQPILIQDIKGHQYAVDKQPTGNLLLQSDLIVQPREAQVMSNSSLLGLCTKQAHVIGPDAQGQTYLLVPNSEKKLPQVRSKSCVPVTAASVEPPGPPIHSSLSLTSMLSSKFSGGLLVDSSENGHIRIQDSAAPSAFHKCASIGSTSKLSDKKVELDLGDTGAKQNQEKDLVCSNLMSASNKMATEAATSNTKFMARDRSPAGKYEPSMKDTAKNTVEQTYQSSCHNPVANNFLDKMDSTSVAFLEQAKNDPIITKVNGDLINSQSLNKVNDSSVQPQQVFRKRKAAVVDSSEHEGKKRTEEGENMENVEPPDPQRLSEKADEPIKKQTSSVHEEKSEWPSDVISVKTSPLSDTSPNQTDTETLLSMIGDTRAMTVKEVVLTLNKLRAKLRDQGEKDSPRPGCDSRASTQDFYDGKQVMKPDEKSRPQRPTRRNTSLNLESLEIDALLDLEPSLDSKLVGDIREKDVLKIGQHSGRRASVGTAVKAHQPIHSDSEASLNIEHKSKSLKRLDTTYTVSETDRANRPASVWVGDFKKSEICVVNEPLHLQPCKKKSVEKTKSCVQNILERGVLCKRDDVAHHFSSVVGLLSRGQDPDNGQSLPGYKKDKIFYKSSGQIMDMEESTSCSEQMKAHDHTEGMNSKADYDSDMPLDVIEFITESMSDDNSYLSNQTPHNPIASWLADFSSNVPGTEPVEKIECDKSASLSVPTAEAFPAQLTDKKLMCETEDTATKKSHAKKKNNSSLAYSQVETDCEQQNILNTRAVSTSCPDGTFLSPTGPARSSRRSSMERMVSGDRNTLRNPVEQPRPLSRLKSRAETPVERFCSTPSDLIIIGKPSVVKKDPFNVRDHTTALMLQQPITSHLPSQASHESPSETCITSFICQGSAELCRADRALSETPVSDPGYSSVGQTPVSEVGGSSVSPSPVMMSLDSTFRPVKSETDNLTHLSESSATYQVLAPIVADQHAHIQVASKSTPLPCSTSASKNSSQTDLSSGSNMSNLNDTLSALSELDQLMSVRLQCIPTPPSSPSGSPQLPKNSSSPCLPELKLADKQYTSASFIAPPCPPNNTQNSSIAPAMYRLSVTTHCPGLVTNSDFVSSGFISRFSPSPHLSVRPSCSPYQQYSHPSPPFTPSSQRCPTPSTITTMSPRSSTPGTESSAAPNRFMPIQTSGILATSMTVTQTYIQPIKPVVTLASAAVQKNLGSLGPRFLGHPRIVPLSTSTFTSTANTRQKSVSCQLNSSVSQRHASKMTYQSHDSKSVLSTSCSIPQKCQSSSKSVRTSTSRTEKVAQPALVLSLGGNMGSVSLSGQGKPIFDHNRQSVVQRNALPTYQEALFNMAGAEQSQTFTTRDAPQYHTVQGSLTVRRVESSLKPENSTPKLPPQHTGTSHELSFTARMSAQLREFYSQSSSGTQQVLPHGMLAEYQGSSISRNKFSREEVSDRGVEVCTPAFSLSHTPDDLEETLDVLKTLDSQYFQHDEDSSSSTSL